MGATFDEDGLQRIDPEAVEGAVPADARTRLGNLMSHVDADGVLLYEEPWVADAAGPVLEPEGRQGTP